MRIHRNTVFITLDIAIVIGLGILGFRWWTSQSQGTRYTTRADLSLQVGQIFIASKNASEPRRTLILALSSTCPVCEATSDFIRRAAITCQSDRGCDVEVLSLDPEPEIRTWLAKHDIPWKRQQTLSSAVRTGLYLTPTVALLDQRRVISDLAVGRLVPSEQQEFLGRVGSANIGQPFNNTLDFRIMNWNEVATTAASDIILDVRTRSDCAGKSRPATTCIPMGDLKAGQITSPGAGSRAGIDCTVISAGACRDAIKAVHSAGFATVFAVVR
jgi:hypothetical protein